MNVDDVVDALKLPQIETGLSEAEVNRRRAEFGPNTIEQQRPRTSFRILLDQFKSSIMAILAVAAVAAFLFEGTADGIAVTAVIVANAMIGFFTELRAVRRMESLAELGTSTVSVRRDGGARELDASQVVPGDVFIVEEGLEVPADARLVETNRLLVDESTLTGESEPVSKQTDAVDEESDLMARSNMLFKGTFVTRGSGEAVVVATGMGTELGEISRLVGESKATHTPLERKLNVLGHRLVYATIGMAVAATVSGIITGRGLVLMVETGIALAIAAIPEGLPIVATIALATGLHEMARRHALVNRLSSVETLGATTVICTDKTGTLTENRLSVAELVVAGDEDTEEELRTLGALCTNVEAGEEVGDPLEIALVRDAKENGLDLERLREEYPEVQEIAFDSSLMEMATIHRDGEKAFAAAKGAPERVLGQCRGIDEEAWLQTADDMSAFGLRVLAVARRSVAINAEQRLEPDDVYTDLRLVGLVGLRDRARPEIRDVIASCHAAGIDVAMVTGDNARTARAVGLDVGIIENESAPVVSGKEIDDYLGSTDARSGARIFARVTPSQKLHIVDWYKEHGAIVAMTGDGVNDAPALERADIGVAMGKRGTDVAAEASDMVLTDDALGSVVAAVRYGRIIFANIRTFVIYLMSCNLAEIVAVGVAVGVAAVASLPLPLLPMQILFLNVVTGVFLVALGPLTLNTDQAVTVGFLTLALGQLWHVFNMRDADGGLLKNDITSNPWVWGAIALCVVLVVGAATLPGISSVLSLFPLPRVGWLLAAGASLVPLVLGSTVRRLIGGDRDDAEHPRGHWRSPT